jgi:hypothetical protein
VSFRIDDIHKERILGELGAAVAQCKSDDERNERSWLRSYVLKTCRIARWFVFKPKIPIWEKFSGPQIGKY